MDILNIADLTSELAVMDRLLVMVLSFALGAFIGWTYKIMHRSTAYSRSIVFPGPERYAARTDLQDWLKEIEPDPGILDRDRRPERQP
jgi:hypothetical protein